MGMARAHKRELRGPLLAAPGLRVVTLDEHAHALLTSGRRPAVRLG
jgi:hypothetical protein